MRTLYTEMPVYQMGSRVEITRGKHRGKKATVSQSANDWVTLNESVEKSRVEIESTLSRYGATAFAYATSQDKAMIQFQADGRRVMFVLNLPDRNLPEFINRTWGGKIRAEKKSPEEAYQDWERACRQLWRALALSIKGKLESVHSKITIFEDEFMAHIVMPDGKTISHHVRPQIQ